MDRSKAFTEVKEAAAHMRQSWLSMRVALDALRGDASVEDSEEKLLAVAVKARELEMFLDDIAQRLARGSK